MLRCLSWSRSWFWLLVWFWLWRGLLLRVWLWFKYLVSTMLRCFLKQSGIWWWSIFSKGWVGLKNMNTVECKFKCIHETSSHPNQNIRSQSLFEDYPRKSGLASTHKCFLVLLTLYFCISSLYNSRKSATCEAFWGANFFWGTTSVLRPTTQPIILTWRPSLC